MTLEYLATEIRPGGGLPRRPLEVRVTEPDPLPPAAPHR